MRGYFYRKYVWLCSLLLVLSWISACNKSKAPPSSETPGSSAYSEIDTSAIATKTGVNFRVVKTDSHGADIRYNFLWICFADGTEKPKVEAVVSEVLDGLIAKFPNIYHSFTFHLFYQKDMKDTCENSRPFADAAFLPGGDRAMVGRVPIDDYKNYRLSFSYAK